LEPEKKGKDASQQGERRGWGGISKRALGGEGKLGKYPL